MTKLFYTLLYASTAALAVAIWVQHDDQGELLELVGSRAHAQSPDPLTPWARDPAAIPGSGGGMMGATNFNQAMLMSQQPTNTQPMIPADANRPASWPSTSPITGPVATQPAVDDGSGLPGVSISKVRPRPNMLAQATVPAGSPYPTATSAPAASPYPTAVSNTPPAVPISAVAAPGSGYPVTNAPPPSAMPATFPSPSYVPPAGSAPPGMTPTNYPPTNYPPTNYPQPVSQQPVSQQPQVPQQPYLQSQGYPPAVPPSQAYMPVPVNSPATAMPAQQLQPFGLVAPQAQQVQAASQQPLGVPQPYAAQPPLGAQQPISSQQPLGAQQAMNAQLPLGAQLPPGVQPLGAQPALGDQTVQPTGSKAVVDRWSVPPSSAIDTSPAPEKPREVAHVAQATSANKTGAPGSNPARQRTIIGTRVLARVGTEFVLESDIVGPVNELIDANIERIPPDQLAAVRENLIKQRLMQAIETKMIIYECKRKVPPEGYKKFEEKIGEHFETSEVPKAVVRSNCKTRAQLEAQLRSHGGSIEREKAGYVERQMAMSWVQQQVKETDEVTHDQMLEYYQQNAKKYEHQARVRWEQIQVRYVKRQTDLAIDVLEKRDGRPNSRKDATNRGLSKAAAWEAIAQAGNQLVDGKPWAEVAKQFSDGPTAATGGKHDWTNKGSLRSEVVDKALFSLPIGQLSPILEDDVAFTIVRVSERNEAGRTPFVDVQPEIKKAIKEERRQEEITKYVTKIRKDVKVWTIYDNEPAPDAAIASRPGGPGGGPPSAAPSSTAGPAPPSQPISPATGLPISPR